MESKDTKKHYYFYLHRNKVNNKVYIGETYQKNPNDRWKNGKAYKPCINFYNAIQKYGWDNFEHIILLEGNYSYEEACQIENDLIEKYQSRNPKYGYNINKGGYKTISPKAEIAAVQWMKEHPEFGLARASDMLKWQKEHPEEAYAYRLQNCTKAAEARKKKVRCIETGEIFESATAAARIVPKTSQSKICMVC